MAKTKKQIRNFILKTLLPYKEDPSICGFDGGGCVYLTNDGEKCAVGRWMKKGEWQNFSNYAKELFENFGQKQILLKPALDMGFNPQQWALIQSYHDAIAMGGDNLGGLVTDMEDEFGIKLPELK